MRHRFWIGLVLTMPVFILEIGSHFPGLHHYIDQPTSMPVTKEPSESAIGGTCVFFFLPLL